MGSEIKSLPAIPKVIFIGENKFKVPSDEFIKLSLEKKAAMNSVFSDIEKLLFKINRLHRKPKSKSKKVRLIRIKKLSAFIIQVGAAYAQYQLIASQPLPQSQ